MLGKTLKKLDSYGTAKLLADKYMLKLNFLTGIL
jgi:hypothetical protein